MREERMKRLFTESQRERGNITVIALMILVVLTLAGIMASRTSTTDVQIAGNEIPYKQNFFIAEGGLNREASELGRGNYAVNQINTPKELANDAGQWNGDSLPSPTPHVVAGTAYNFTLDYLGYFLPPPGYSVIHFSRYDYDIDATGAKVNVDSRYYKIGPKAE
jgi:hypothetical protein